VKRNFTAVGDDEEGGSMIERTNKSEKEEVTEKEDDAPPCPFEVWLRVTPGKEYVKVVSERCVRRREV
jgi:hypothetical protein